MKKGTSICHAYVMAKAYMVYASRASDGTIFVPSPVASVASANLAICQLDKDGKLVRVYGDHLFANVELAAEKAKTFRDSYERALKGEGLL